jgi:HEAT repeat protein
MWLEQGMAQLVERVRGRPWHADVERLGAEVQRFGDQAFRKITERWPALAELVRERKVVSARYRPREVARAPEPPLSEQAIVDLIAQLQSSSSWPSRVAAASQLAHVEALGVIPALSLALRDASAEVAVAAVDALSSHHDSASTAALTAVLANADAYFSPITRVAAIVGLARRLSLSELGPIFAAVRDIDAEVSIAAIAVIAERVPALAKEHVLPILRDNAGYYLPLVRLAAANALERSGGLRDAGLAAELMAVENDPSVRRVLERAQYFVPSSDSFAT